MTMNHRASISLAVLIGALLNAGSVTALPAQGDRLGTEWSVSEGGVAGRWVRRGTSATWDASWTNGAVAVLTFAITGDRVKITRREVSGPSAGLIATYDGTLALDGSIEGTEVVTTPFQLTQKWQGRIVKGVQPAPTPSPTPTPSPVASPAQGDRLGTEWSVSEGGVAGRWVRRGTSATWDASWTNGAVAVLTFAITGDRVKITRREVSGPSAGLIATYDGTLALDGSIEGTEVVTTPFQLTQKWQGRIVKGVQPAPTPSPTPTPSPIPSPTPTPSPTPPPSTNAIQYRVENFVFNAPDIYQNPRNYHDFMVDWAACTVRELNKQSEQGQEQIRVLVCRKGSRLTFIASMPNATPVEYDWVFSDGGKTIGGAYRQGGTFGPSVGGRR